MDIEKHILLNKLYSNYYLVGKKLLITLVFFGTIPMDLYKLYDCLLHDLIIAKFKVYGLRKNSLKLLLDYLAGRKQHVKIDSS